MTGPFPTCLDLTGTIGGEAIETDGVTRPRTGVM